MTERRAAEAPVGVFDSGVGGDAKRPDTLLLGCTHFPVFAPLIARMLGRA